MRMHNPPHPGEFIREVYITPYGISVRKVAASLGVSLSTLNLLLNGESNISPEMALRYRRL
ncbi:addiction module antidote protein, HigA family [Nitrosococcus halophilus Nc 4]|uniref:Addiction module antidote protein, HigA family n=1 Tax=Nitrosococcus halophilus (strain Nc4) TaxID=472759 RepID=D5BWE9_NITHN|nr:addiction module antidote protein, HigA family [Nitrosococcus halophilus Nc 4]